jgi:hypothetical protein
MLDLEKIVHIRPKARAAAAVKFKGGGEPAHLHHVPRTA